MLTIEDCMDLGALIAEEQIDFLRHPEERLAVVLYGVPDPDRLYIAGPDDAGHQTLYQQAWYGEPADSRDMQAVLLPLVIEGGDQDDFFRIFLDNDGDIKATVPFVLGTPVDCAATELWLDETTPFHAAPWDLWPITIDEMNVWIEASNASVLRSALPVMTQFFDTFQNGTEHELVDEDMEDEDFNLLERIRRLEKEYQGHPEQDEELAAILERREEIREEQGSVGQRIMARWEHEITHPLTGDIDAQMPPAELPPEQAVIWRSLQSLSWRNWSVLKKQVGDDSDALYGSRFVQANRRLCPWY